MRDRASTKKCSSILAGTKFSVSHRRGAETSFARRQMHCGKRSVPPKTRPLHPCSARRGAKAPVVGTPLGRIAWYTNGTTALQTLKKLRFPARKFARAPPPHIEQRRFSRDSIFLPRTWSQNTNAILHCSNPSISNPFNRWSELGSLRLNHRRAKNPHAAAINDMCLDLSVHSSNPESLVLGRPC